MLSTSSKYKILDYLGYPVKTLDTNAVVYSKIISDRLSNFDADAEAIINDMIAKLDAIEVRLDKAVTRAGVKSVDDIEFFGGEGGSSELGMIRSERLKLIRKLASFLDIPVGANARGGMQGRVSI